PSQDCNPHESICAKPRIEFICATHCANPTGGVRAFGVGQMLCRQVVVLQWQCQVGNSRRSVGACGSRQGVLKYWVSRDTRLCRARRNEEDCMRRAREQWAWLLPIRHPSPAHTILFIMRSVW